MTNIALLALTITLAAEAPAAGSAEAAQTTETADGAPTARAAAKPPEKDIEVLSDVVDLQETEDPAAAWYGTGFPSPVRLLALPTARTVRAGGWEFIVDHRSGTPLYDNSTGHPYGNMWNTFLGFDSSIRVGLAFRYGLIDDLDLGMYRAGSSQTDTYEFDARYQILHQSTMELDLAVRAGITWFSQPNAADASGYFGQLLATRLLWNRILLTGGALYHSNSTNDTKYNQDKAWSAALAAGVEVRVAASVGLDAEVVSCTAGYCSKNPTFSGGVKYITNRHTFALLCGNTAYLTSDGYITNTDRPWSKLAIGFNITRKH